MCRKANDASFFRSSSVNPPARTAASTPSYPSGSTTTATLGWFFAAARTIDGPPMSICSTHSSMLAPESTVSVNGIQVDDHEFECGDAEFGQRRNMFGFALIGEQAGMHVRVQGLDPAVEHLGEAGDLLDRA